MELLKQKVKELIVNQDNMLKAVKYLQETIENISENRNNDNGNVEDMLESRAMSMKNSTEIEALIKSKQENDTTLKMSDTRIDILNSELETLKSTIKDKPIVKDEPAVKDKPVDKGKLLLKTKCKLKRQKG